MQNNNFEKNDVYLVKRTNCKFTNNNDEDNKKVGDIYIMSKWPKTELVDNDDQKHKIDIVLQTSINGNCFAGELNIEELHSIATELQMSYEMLKGECHLALTADDNSDTLSLYKFVLERNSNENLLTLWKHQSNVQIQYFDVKLREQQNNADMLDVLVALVQKMPQTTVVPLLDATSQTVNSQLNMNAALKECANAKKQLERELMSKFCLLLNSKKEKINDLENQLKELMANEKPTTSASSSSKTNRTETMEHDDDDFDADTEQMTLPI